MRGELDRVAQQVDEDLAQPGLVAPRQGRHAGGDFVEQVELLFGGFGGENVERALDAFAHGEFLVLGVEAAGFDLGKIEDVVDYRQQRVAAVADGLDAVALLRA